MGRLVPNPHLLIGPHLRLEAVPSSRIEGTKTDVGQLLLYEVGQVSSRDAADDAAEVNNYVLAMEHGLERVRGGFPISIRLLREMHEQLLQGVRGQHRRPGELRSSPGWIGGSTLEDAVFVHPPPDESSDDSPDLVLFHPVDVTGGGDLSGDREPRRPPPSRPTDAISRDLPGDRQPPP